MNQSFYSDINRIILFLTSNEFPLDLGLGTVSINSRGNKLTISSPNYDLIDAHFRDFVIYGSTHIHLNKPTIQVNYSFPSPCSEIEAQLFANNITLVFRLFHPCHIDSWLLGMYRVNNNSVSIIHFNQEIKKEFIFPGLSSHKTNFSTFSSFLEKILEFLPDKEPLRINKLSVACQRYKDVLLSSGNEPERIIAQAISGLEALFTDNEPELGFHLQLRVANLLRSFGSDAQKVRDIIKNAYKIRSKYVHGAPMNEKDKEKIECVSGSTIGFIYDLGNLLRISIIARIFTTKQITDNDLKTLLDDVSFDSKKEEDLSGYFTNTIDVVNRFTISLTNSDYNDILKSWDPD